MFITFKESKIFYEVVGCGKNVVVFLCGWGYGSEVIKPLAKNLSDENFTKIFVDFPCFGKSENVKTDWILADYAEMIYTVLQTEKISAPIKIVAHSFGGKVAILLANKYNIVESLVLVASAGIKPKFSLSKTLKVWRFKIRRKLGKNVLGFGSEDYRALPNVAKKTFVNIVNTHVENECKQITCKTLILAGKNDDATPLYMQKKLHKLIGNSALKIYNNSNHYVWLGNFESVTNDIKNFLEN